MNTFFQRNDRLRARVTNQNLHQGMVYMVVDVESQRTPFGTFCTYELRPEHEAKTVFVRNAHLLLDREV